MAKRTKSTRAKRQPPQWPSAKPYCANLEVAQWHERDRNHVHVRTKESGRTVAEWWDSDVHQMVEDGFFKPGHRGVNADSVLEYVSYAGLCRRGPAPDVDRRRGFSGGGSTRCLERDRAGRCVRWSAPGGNIEIRRR